MNALSSVLLIIVVVLSCQVGILSNRALIVEQESIKLKSQMDSLKSQLDKANSDLVQSAIRFKEVIGKYESLIEAIGIDYYGDPEPIPDEY